MNILLLNYRDLFDVAAGGSENYVRRVAECWRENGHDVCVFVPQSAGRPTAEWINGVRYQRCGGMHTVFPAARRYLRRHAPTVDIVIEVVNARPFHASRIAKGKVTILVHQTFHETWDREFPFPVNVIGRRVLEPLWLRTIARERVVTVSDSSAFDLRRYGVHPVGIVPPACDAPPWTREHPPRRRRRTRPPRLVFVGRLIEAKNPWAAIAAHGAVRRVHPGATLDIVGQGYLEGELRRLAAPGVTVRGFLPEDAKHELLGEADLLLVTSSREGWGIVTTEAGLHGVPVVAYDAPGLCDSVVDGVTGVLTAHNPEAMGEAALELLDDDDRWTRMSSAAWMRARPATWMRSAERLLALAAEERGVRDDAGRAGGGSR